MSELTTFEPTASCDDVLAAIKRDGGAIVTDLLGDDLRQRVIDETDPWIKRSPDGNDEFQGRSTIRTGALIARSEACRELAVHPFALSVAEAFLGPFTNKIQLHLTQTIRIKSGQPKQTLHRDRDAWGGYIPLEIEPQLSTMWALTDFTIENGATQIVPGSSTWSAGRQAEPDEIARATMSAGSALLFSGSVIHGGGENRSDAQRTGLQMTYCLAWLRTEENQFLSCPPYIAKDLDPQLQELLGYTMGNYALGYYSDPEAGHDVSDLLPPEIALGCKPRKKAKNTALGN